MTISSSKCNSCSSPQSHCLLHKIQFAHIFHTATPVVIYSPSICSIYPQFCTLYYLRLVVLGHWNCILLSRPEQKKKTHHIVYVCFSCLIDHQVVVWFPKTTTHELKKLTATIDIRTIFRLCVNMCFCVCAQVVWGAVWGPWRHFVAAVRWLPAGPQGQDLPQDRSLDATLQRHHADTVALLQQRFLRCVTQTVFFTHTHTKILQ